MQSRCVCLHNWGREESVRSSGTNGQWSEPKSIKKAHSHIHVCLRDSLRLENDCHYGKKLPGPHLRQGSSGGGFVLLPDGSERKRVRHSTKEKELRCSEGLPFASKI